MMKYSGIQQIQLDTARKVRIQLDTVVGYSGIQWQWICCKMARDKDTAGYQGYTVRYRQADTGAIQAGCSPKIHARGGLPISEAVGYGEIQHTTR